MNDSASGVWLVTGAAGALGAALVERVMRDGADCIAVDRDERGLEGLHDRLQEAIGRAPALMPMDLAGARPEDFERLAEAIDSEFGRIDVLVHNAAAFEALRPMLQTEPGEWMRVLQTGVTAPFMLTAVLALQMNGEARVVWISDEHCLDKPAGWGAYGVAQAARRQMAAILTAERAGRSPAVVEVDPGPFYSRLRTAAWPSDSPENLPPLSEAVDRVVSAAVRGLD
jgi:NAD(P)-dependent dehydrogenase (short-subunit alcohol dehydrogenase family)